MTRRGWVLSCEVPTGWLRIDTTDPRSWPADPAVASMHAVWRAARRRGVVLWAGRLFGARLAGVDTPESMVNLTLTVMPAAPGPPPRDPPHSAPFDFPDPRLHGFLTVGTSLQPLPGLDRAIELFQLDIYAVADAADLVAVVTVTTADPARCQDATVAAVVTARSLRLRPGDAAARPAPVRRVP